VTYTPVTEVEIPWHPALKPARDAFIDTQHLRGAFAELRPGTTEWGRVDLVDPRTGLRLGSPPAYYGKKWETFAREYKAQNGTWPLVAAGSAAGGLYVSTPLKVAVADGTEVKPPPPITPPISAPTAPSTAEKAGGLVSRLFGIRR
jgi:hypothetical protein